MNNLDAAISKANERWPTLNLKRQTPSEASGPCPFCGGKDRFNVFAKGNYWCRQCDTKGWLDEEDSEWSKLSDTEKRLRRLEAEQASIKRRQEEHERRLSALERMHACTDHLTYHNNLTTDLMNYWVAEGMTVDSIVNYQLGYCPSCPTAPGRPSYTIPVKSNDRLWNIRHRLIDAPGGDKYRPHLAGLPTVLFNADNLRADTQTIAIVEGEKKSIVAAQTGIPNVGTIGCQGFKPEWAGRFAKFEAVYVALDPDAMEQAYTIARLFGGRGRVVRLPLKIDDMVTHYGATLEDLRGFFRVARPAR